MGGDYFDIIESPERSYIVVGDISGKGMAAALYMVNVQSIIHMLLESLSGVKEIIINLKNISPKILEENIFDSFDGIGGK